MVATRVQAKPEIKTTWRVLYLALPLILIVGALVAYKSTTALGVIGKVQASGVFNPRANIIPLVGSASTANILARTLNYFLVIWPALLFGILISGGVRTFVSPAWLARKFGGGSLRSQLFAGATGAPLMLCSCCVAPIFSSVYERSTRLGPSLALMLAAPALNPAALLLTFLLFDHKIAATRVVASLAAVLFIGRLADKVFRDVRPDCEPSESLVADPPGPFELLSKFARSCGQIAVRLIPVIVIGVLVSMAVAQMLPVSLFSSPAARLLSVFAVAAVAVPLAMPTFFEIPLALILLASGAPAGAAVAMLIAGPAVNLPSLFTITRVTSWKIAALVAASVWSLAVAAGLIVNLLS